MILSGKQMLHELSPAELTIGKKNTASEGIYGISDGRSETPGDWKREKNGDNES